MVGRQGHLALLRPAGGELPPDVHPGGPGGGPGHSERALRDPPGQRRHPAGAGPGAPGGPLRKKAVSLQKDPPQKGRWS